MTFVLVKASSTYFAELTFWPVIPHDTNPEPNPDLMAWFGLYLVRQVIIILKLLPKFQGLIFIFVVGITQWVSWLAYGLDDPGFHLAPRLRMSGAVPLLPLVCLHGMDRDNFITYMFSVELWPPQGTHRHLLLYEWTWKFLNVQKRLIGYYNLVLSWAQLIES